MSGVSSFYAEDFHGKLTANGEVYDMYGLTAAHKTLPLNTICRVTNMKNNKSLILRINDRGPYIKGRILDCSYGAAKKLGFVNDGTTEVKIEVMEWGDNLYMQTGANKLKNICFILNPNGGDKTSGKIFDQVKIPLKKKISI